MNFPVFIKIAKVEGSLQGATITWDWNWDGASPAPNVFPLGERCVVTNQAIGPHPSVLPDTGVLTLTPKVECNGSEKVLGPITLAVELNFVEPSQSCCFQVDCPPCEQVDCPPCECELFWETSYLSDDWSSEWTGGYANQAYIFRAKLLGVSDDANVSWRFVFNSAELPIITDGSIAEIHAPMDAGYGDLYATYMGIECGPLQIGFTYGT